MKRSPKSRTSSDSSSDSSSLDDAGFATALAAGLAPYMSEEGYRHGCGDIATRSAPIRKCKYRDLI